MSDNEKIDLKARLGRKRLRTSSQKGLENELPGGEETYERPPTGEQRAVSDAFDGVPAPPSMPSVPAPGMPSMPMAAPQAAPAEIHFKAGGNTKLMLILVAVCVGLPALGFGWCTGHRKEQNNLVNQATDDAKLLKSTLDLALLDLSRFQQAFAAPPGDISAWLGIGKNAAGDIELNMKVPDVGDLATMRLNYIATPRMRRDFLSNLINFYFGLNAINAEYARFLGFMYELEKFREVVDAMKAIEDKQIVAESKDEYLVLLLQRLNRYVIQVREARLKAVGVGDSKAKQYWMLVDGSIGAINVIPVQAEMLVCPAAKERCQEYEKVVRFGPEQSEFTREIPQNVKLTEARLVLEFQNVAEKSIDILMKTEIVDPMVPRWQNAVDSFYELRRLIRETNEAATKVIPVLDEASKRKKRSFL